MLAQNDIAHKLFVLPRVLQHSWRGLDGSFDIDEAGAAQRFGGAFRILKEPRLAEIRQRIARIWARPPEHRLACARHAGSDRRRTALPAILPGARPTQAPKQAIVIEHPMKCGGADDTVEHTLKWQVQKVGSDQPDPARLIVPADARALSSACSVRGRWRLRGLAAALPAIRQSGGRCRSRRRARIHRHAAAAGPAPSCPN